MVLLLLVFLQKFEKKQLIASSASFIGFIVTVLLFYSTEKNMDFYKQFSTRLAMLILLATCVTILFRGIYKYDRKLLVVTAAMVFQYVAWMFITRVVFIYHYFSIVPFLILAIVYIIKKFDR